MTSVTGSPVTQKQRFAIHAMASFWPLAAALALSCSVSSPFAALGANTTPSADDTVYVSNHADNTISGIDGATRKVVVTSHRKASSTEKLAAMVDGKLHASHEMAASDPVRDVR